MGYYKLEMFHRELLEREQHYNMKYSMRPTKLLLGYTQRELFMCLSIENDMIFTGKTQEEMRYRDMEVLFVNRDFYLEIC